MLQRFSRSNSLLRIIYEDLPKQVQEQSIELPRLPWRIGERVVEVAIFEEARSAVAVAALRTFRDFFDKGFVDAVAGYGLCND